MGPKLSLLLFLLAFSTIDEINARRISFGRSSSRGGSRTSGGSRTNGGWGRGSGNTHSSSGGSSSGHSSGQSSSVHHGTSGGSYTPHQTSHVSNVGQTAHQQNKDLSTSILHAERGGVSRPEPPKSPQYPFSHASAPSLESSHGTGTGTQTFGQSGKPNLPYVPSAPSMEHSPKVSTVPLQNGAPTSFGQHGQHGQYGRPYNPAQGSATPTNQWSNPHLGPNQPAPPGFQPPNIGFKDEYKPQGLPHLPYPSAPVHHPQPSQTGNLPHPTNYPGSYNPSHLYPVNSPGNHPPQTPGYPYSPSVSGHPYPPAGHPYPSAGHPYPSQIPVGSPYAIPPVGSPHGIPGQSSVFYPQQPQVLAQPAAQPFVPGQTVIMMPGQQDSGRGFGRVLGEALIFSTVNAGVNRLINPPHTHVIQSQPAAGTTGTTGGTTHITYNQYYNGVPVNNGTTDATNIQPNMPPNMPTGAYSPTGPISAGPVSGSSVPSFPGTMNNDNNPPSNPTTTVNHGVSASNTLNNQGNTSNAGATVGNELTYKISNEELAKISEDLYAKSSFNVSKYLRVNLQNRTTSPNVTDLAKNPLFYVEPELLDYPSIYVTRSLFDNYEHNATKKENRTLEKRKEENLLIDTYLNTNTMVAAMRWLSDKGFIDPDDFERKDVLRRIWFNQFSGTTSGFERVFTSEKYGDFAVIGVQDWLYFEYLETLGRINYMGYADSLPLGNSSSLLKLNFGIDGVVRTNATIFVGTLPEFEMSLYTICFFARPNDICPVSVGGAKFNIYTHSFRYYGIDLIDLALPIF